MNKTILITGSSSGIGKASTKLFAEEGWNVIATMRNPTDSHEFINNSNVLVTHLDVQDFNSIKEAVATGVSKFGGIDVLLNNAGYGQYGVFEAVPRKKVIDQFGLMDTIREVLPVMRKKNSGVIINMSSGAGIFTLPMISLYSASKFAVEGFSEALSYELLSLGIIVKIVEPHGGVNETSFNQRSSNDSSSLDQLDDYNSFIQDITKAFSSMSAARLIDSSDVSKVVFEAATDGTDRLRYLVGNDTRGFIKARYELQDHDYVKFMRDQFI
jgi:NAD(P)-dependent dehydrogenase (short-subunit alcohol dehydrogenase family)